MAYRNFKKEDFAKVQDEYQLEFRIAEIGEGVNLIVEKEIENGKYEVVQTPIKRLNDSIFVCWSEPFNGRVIYEN